MTPLCGHRDVNAIVDATGDPTCAATIDELAAETVKRVSRPAPDADSLTRLEALDRAQDRLAPGRLLAEREGFEPSDEVDPRHTISSRARSTAPAPLQESATG